MIGFLVVLWVWLNLILSSRDFIIDNIVIGILYIWERFRIFKFFFYLFLWIFFRNFCYLSFFWFFIFFIFLMVMFFGFIISWFWLSGRYKKFLYDILFGVFGLDFRYFISCFLSFLGSFGSLWILLFRMKEWYR